ncbi:MAG TPA: cation transporter, partial [Streptosporangiaceae bacterium]|nr:cation transporter [Streptosporangiaceae bacterium]
MTSATYQVTGMTCEHCVHAVTGELKNLDGVTGVTVELVPGGPSVVTV